MTKKTWAEAWGEEQPDYSMGKSAMKKLLRKIRTSTARRVQSLSKQKSFSYAARQFDQSMKKTYLGGKTPNLNTMTYRQMERELRMHHQFWSSKTATVKGAREEQIEQSKRIFGMKGGKPTRVMTYEESVAFWKAYDEFYNMYKNSTSRFDSTRIQQVLGNAMTMGGEFFDVDADLVMLLEDAMEELERRAEYEEQGYEYQDYNPSKPKADYDPNLLTYKSWKKMVKEVYKGNGDALKR